VPDNLRKRLQTEKRRYIDFLKKNLKGICPKEILDSQLFSKSLQKRKLQKPTIDSIVEIAKGKKRVKTAAEENKELTSARKVQKPEKASDVDRDNGADESEIYSASESDDEREEGRSNEDD